MGFLKHYPDPELLLAEQPQDSAHPLKVNNHIHTPFSFSAFGSVEEAVQLAVSEEIGILGINDFYTTNGYEEFVGHCLKRAVFPLLNVEMIGVSKPMQEQGIRINDPNNPGRIYISGKGLAHPSVLPQPLKEKVSNVIRESNHQVAEMVELVNRWMEKQGVDITLSVEEMMRDEARDLLRERHVARMLRLKLNETFIDNARYVQALKTIFGGSDPSTSRDDVAGTEDELRAKLLKSGAPAFVPEEESAFMPVEEITRIITEAGGIPTYPLLVDGAGGSITTFESNKEALLQSLQKEGIRSVELIPLRNRFERVKEYTEFFYHNGFVVSFGTEHNTSAMRPLTVSCKGGVPLDRHLMEISFRGAAAIAAHQYLVEKEGKGYTERNRDEMERLGRAVIRHFLEEKQ
ncbi:MAG: hypothetical protein ACWGNV_00570 [Bacteroidales bacterium]